MTTSKSESSSRDEQNIGLKLLSDTFTKESDHTLALCRVLDAMNTGELTVNGQQPDENYFLGEYLIHGGRIKFDVSDLSAEEQESFFKWITAGKAKSRAFATHRAGGTDASGAPAEEKSGSVKP